jgi:hypothetical protein
VNDWLLWYSLGALIVALGWIRSDRIRREQIDELVELGWRWKSLYLHLVNPKNSQ